MTVFLKAAAERCRSGFRDILTAAAAATLSWMLAKAVFGHPHPIFAAVTAIVCLAPGLPSHGRQGIGILIGVTIGIVIGELSFAVPEMDPALRIGATVLLAMLAGLALGAAPVIAIQAGVSALLVLALGPAAAGTTRLLDVVTGTAVGLLFSQVLFTPDPVRVVDSAGRRMLRSLAEGFALCEAALQQSDPAKAMSALTCFSAAHEGLVALQSGMAKARGTLAWTLRGRLAARDIKDATARYDRRAVRFYAASLLLGEAIAAALKWQDGPQPAGLERQLREITGRCRRLAGDPPPAAQDLPEDAPDSAAPEQAMPEAATLSPRWRYCMEHLRTADDVLAALEEVLPRRVS